MEKIKTKIKISKNLKNPVAVGAGEPLVIVKDVAKGFGKEELFSGARLRVMPRERIAIVGANGMGKTTLLRIIIGQEDPDDGACEINKAARIGYLPQETHWESLQNSVIDEIQSSDPGMREMTARKNDYEKRKPKGRFPKARSRIIANCWKALKPRTVIAGRD
jgi:ATPase components of ABC transporters with duplicated ATPase domains